MKGNFATLLLAASILPAVAHAGAMPLPLVDNQTTASSKQAPAAKQPEPDAGPGADQTALIERYGQIISRVPLGAGGLTAWTVEKNGRRVVLYTTGDGQAIISGVVWEARSGRNLSDQFVPNVIPRMRPIVPTAPAKLAAEMAAASKGMTGGGALLGKYSGEIPESIKTIDSLSGIKEGKGGQADTLYVIFDPRCPFCRKAYLYTRDYVKRGFTIKWIPVVALGNPAQGAPIASTILQAKPDQQAEVLRRVLGNKEEVASTPTKATIEALDRNLNFFFAAFQNNRVEQAGVPAAFFLDKRTGKPRMMTGISETPVIEEVFGKL